MTHNIISLGLAANLILVGISYGSLRQRVKHLEERLERLEDLLLNQLVKKGGMVT